MTYDGDFIYLYQNPMPPKPWPLTIAGIPFYIAPEYHLLHTPLPDLIPIHCRNGAIHADQNGRDLEDWSPLFKLVRIHFVELEIPITEVMYWGNLVIIVWSTGMLMLTTNEEFTTREELTTR